MRIAIGGLLFEGNTFSLARTSLAEFRQNYLHEGDAILSGLRGGDVEVSGALQVLQAQGAELVPLIATHGGCGGQVTRECFETLKEKLLARLRGHAVDGVFLALHGAMICEQTDDAEAELLEAVRALVGAVPIVITCDLHAHITPRLLALCDAIVGYQQYPHDDPFETGVRAAGILVRAVAGGARPVMAMKKLAMLVSPTAAGTRERTPMRAMYKAARAIEALPGVLALSYFPSTPWAEREEGGTAFVLVTDGVHPSAGEILDGLCRQLWAARAEFEPGLLDFDQAVAATAEEAGPIILSEMSDAVGAGAAGDSAYVLGRFLAMDAPGPLLVQVVDPGAVAAARRAGAGAELSCELGNRIETRYGPPVPFSGLVERLLDDGAFTYRGGLMGGITSTMGPSAVLRGARATVLVTSRPTYEYADEQYVAAGIDIRKFRYVVVKNPMNYKQAYSWAPRLVALDTPGAGRADLRKLAWTRCRRPFYPMDDSPGPLWRNN